MTAEGVEFRGRRRGMIAAIAAISIFAFSLSLSLPLFSLLLDEMGASATMIGVNGAAGAAAVLIGGIFVPALLKRISLPAVMGAATVSLAALLPVFLLIPDQWAWIGLRFLFGLPAAALFVCSEIWIVSAAPPARRGFFVGVYGLFLALGFLSGPLLLKLVGTEGWAPFLAGSAIALCATAPILLFHRDAPEMGNEESAAPSEMLRFFRTDPAVIWGVLLFAMVESGAMGLFPVWALRAGGDQAEALTLVALLAAGNLVFQIPLGWAGDRWNRRRLLGLCAAACAASAIIFPALFGTGWPIWTAALVWGGLVVGLYSFSLIEIGARYSGPALARATSAFAMSYGFGALVAPPVMGLAMDMWPPHGMFGVLAAASLAYLALLLLRRGRVRAVRA